MSEIAVGAVSAGGPGNTGDPQLVSFLLGCQEYGVEIGRVQEIIRKTEITPVPRTPEFVQGVVNLRGRIVPVMDLRKRLGLPAAPLDRQARIVIVTANGTTAGLLVDRVNEVLRIPDAAIEPPPELVASGATSEFLRGVGKLADRLVILLDLDRVLGGRGAESAENGVAACAQEVRVA